MLHGLMFFNEELFMYLLLPPIIFEAGLSLSRHHFFANLATILIFAVFGTLATTAIVGLACQMAGRAGWFAKGSEDALDFRSPKDAFTFGALISATDPVATLSIMGAFKVEPLMFTLVAGESVLNDAVAIVLVRILSELGDAVFDHPAALLSGLGQFVAVSIGSLLVGIGVAAPSALLLKHVDLSHHAAFELSLVIIFGYCAYCTAEIVHGSGILALFVASVLIGHYHVHSLSAEARAALPVALKSLAHLAETFVFAYMGLDLVARKGAVDDMLDESVDVSSVETPDEAVSTRCFVLFAVCAVPLARALVMPPLVLLANCLRGRKRSLTAREAIFLVFAGLRGAIAFALAKNAPSEHRPTIVAATTAVVLFTTIVLGGFTRTMLSTLGMIASPDGPGSAATVSAGTSDAVNPPLPNPRSDGGKLARRWKLLDESLLQPLFGAPHAAAAPERLSSQRGGKAAFIEMQPLQERHHRESPPGNRSGDLSDDGGSVVSSFTVLAGRAS